MILENHTESCEYNDSYGWIYTPKTNLQNKVNENERILAFFQQLSARSKLELLKSQPR